MALNLTKINDIVIRPICKKKSDGKLIKGDKYFAEIYSNIFVCAKKHSGKTNLIYNILKACMGRETRLIIFSSTITRDDTYKHMIDAFEKKGNPVLTYMGITEGKVDVLAEMLEELRNSPIEDEDEEEEEEVQNPFFLLRTLEQGMAEEKKKKKKRKEKYLAPEIIFIFDDLSKELRKNSVAMLLKSNRHYKCKTIISSQYPNDVQPESLRQLDYCILFGGHDPKKLEKIWTDLDLSIPVETFIDIYTDATSKEFSFLYIDRLKMKFRKNMNQEFKIKNLTP